jgi:mono/diheme cytochrome c family protein
MSPRRAAGAPLLVLLAVGCGGGSTGERAAAPAPARAPAPDATRGQVVYETRCAPCHGTDGGGNGPAAAGIDPRPRNFHDQDFWRGRTVEQLRLVVRQGKPGTLMPPFDGALDGGQIDDVVAFIQQFRPATP